VTHWLDLSHVYGNNDAEANATRFHQEGKLTFQKNLITDENKICLENTCFVAGLNFTNIVYTFGAY
jgi:hypothetical protein